MLGRRLNRPSRWLYLAAVVLVALWLGRAWMLYVDGGLFRPSPDDVRVEFELGSAGRWVAEYYPCEQVTELGDGRLKVVLQTPDTRWVKRLALRLGEDGRVTGPADLVREIEEEATAALAQYA